MSNFIYKSLQSFESELYNNVKEVQMSTFYTEAVPETGISVLVNLKPLHAKWINKKSMRTNICKIIQLDENYP